jgi:hypothetical protein
MTRRNRIGHCSSIHQRCYTRPYHRPYPSKPSAIPTPPIYFKRYAPKKGDDNTYMIEPFLSEMPRINVSMMSVSTTRRLQSRVHQCLHVLSKKRSFASINRSNYIDEWQRSILKSPEFYEENAAPGLKRKNYFYNIDLQGRIFLGTGSKIYQVT